MLILGVSILLPGILLDLQHTNTVLHIQTGTMHRRAVIYVNVMWWRCTFFFFLCVCVCVCVCVSVGKCTNWILQKFLIVFYSLHHGEITVNSWWVKETGCSIFMFPFLMSELHQDRWESYKGKKMRMEESKKSFFVNWNILTLCW